MGSKIHRRPSTIPHNFEGIFTVAPQMHAFFETLEKVARADSSVLIRGETGTGKELVARALHRLSRRRGEQFDAVNCASLTSEMLASELFGNVKGAFTGAVKERKGLLRQVNKGTLFLDEIAEMPLDIQARMLRVLQERTFVPLGGTERVSVDVRLISATHVALRAAAAKGTFRSDLMFRVRVLPIFLPPLRERVGDVEALTWLFVQEFAAREGDFPIHGIDDVAFDALVHYQWPGNIRELRNVIEYAVVMAKSSIITLDDLPPELRGEIPVDAAREAISFEANEAQAIRLALQSAEGDRQRAADLLEMSRATLWRKMKEFGIAWPRARQKSSRTTSSHTR